MDYEENNNHENMVTEPSEEMIGLEYLKSIYKGMPSFEEFRAEYAQEK